MRHAIWGLKIMKTHIIIKRYCIFFIGLIFCALGISFVTRAGLGTSPVSGLPFVISLITGISMGTFTFLFNMLFLILEAILRRKFTLQQALQIPITFAFSFFIDRFMAMIPTRFGGPWGSSFVYLMIGCVVMALGISLEVMADVIMLPAEALVRAISQTTGMKFGNVKVGFDSFLTESAMVVALLAFHKLNGVREGTLINAIAVGNIVKLWRKLLEGAITAFLEK